MYRDTTVFVFVSCKINIALKQLLGNRPIGRPRRRWNDYINIDLNGINREEGKYTELAQNHALLLAVWNLLVLLAQSWL
jgi:hypothetical protein